VRCRPRLAHMAWEGRLSQKRAAQQVLLWVCCALSVSPPAICLGTSVLSFPAPQHERRWPPGASAAHLAAAPECLRCAGLQALRLSGGADDDDTDSESHEVRQAPRLIGSEGRGVPATVATPDADVPERDGAGDRVLELVKDKQTQLDKDKVFAGLRNLYLSKVKPLEEASWYSFFTPGVTLDAADFDAKPIVLLLGQYSVGKTSFIRSLLGHDFAGMRIGPEPTTDQFIAVMHGRQISSKVALQRLCIVSRLGHQRLRTSGGDEGLAPGHVLCTLVSRVNKLGN